MPGTADRAVLVDDPNHTYTLSADALALLAAWLEPATVEAQLGDVSAEIRAGVDALVKQGLLVPADAPRAATLNRQPVHPPAFASGRWDGAPAPGAVLVVGCRFDGGTLAGYPRGSAEGPGLVRAATRYLPALDDLEQGRPRGFHDPDGNRDLAVNVRILDGGDLVPGPATPRATLDRALGDLVREARAAGITPIVVGGDHSITWPLVAAQVAPAFGVVHFDAHADVAQITFDGDLHHGNVMRHVAGLPAVQHIIQIGVRGVHAQAQGVDGVEYQVLPCAAARLTPDRQLARLCRSDLPYYLSFDIDALDPGVASGTPVPEPDGFGLGEARRILRAVLGRNPILGADLVEVAPALDTSRTTGTAAAQLIVEMIDAIARGQRC